MFSAISYYDPFNVDEEEDFWANEQERIEQDVVAFIERITRKCCGCRRHCGMEGDTYICTCNFASTSSVKLSSSITSNTFMLDFALQPQQLQRIVNAIIETQHQQHHHHHNNSRSPIDSLSFRHWGLGNSGIVILTPLWTMQSLSSISTLSLTSRSSHLLQHLSLASCGLTSPGLVKLLNTLTTSSGTISTLQSLDVRRNNFRCHEMLLVKAFTKYLPKLQGTLQRLDISGCGLTQYSIPPLLDGLSKIDGQLGYCCCPLVHVDISENIDSTPLLLETILRRHHLQRLVQHNTQLQSLVLVRSFATSSSMYIDAQDECSVRLLQQLAQQLLPVDDASVSTSLVCLGSPISLMPMDPTVSEEDSSMWQKRKQKHDQCQRALDDIQFALQYHATHPSLRLFVRQPVFRTGALLPFAFQAIRNDVCAKKVEGTGGKKTVSNVTTRPMVMFQRNCTNTHWTSSVSKAQQQQQQVHDHHQPPPSLLYHWIRHTLPVFLPQ
ncbi:hypothetical protein IV203_036931 [Nitzschia inconspicua]|uniref:Uncharacterized protein n=1 Tax=Nitzschia inconspicua TaxID=303405 RepID=A0A9K3LH88_9STRA|nr:hypothetical protein IV203_036931 [Nitzschia inconspicua]